MYKKQLPLSSLLIAAMALTNGAFAASITNGNFDADLTGWSTVTNGGTAQWEAGKAVLSTGPDVAPYSSVLVQGDDGFFTFTNPILLGAGDDLFKFEAVFATLLGGDALETGVGFSDNLQVWLYDANGLGDVLIASIDALTAGGPSFSFNLTPYIGHSVAFSFELNDEDDGFDAKASIDTIRIEQRTTPVPEPGALLLVMIGGLGLIGGLLRNNRKVQTLSL